MKHSAPTLLPIFVLVCLFFAGAPVVPAMAAPLLSDQSKRVATTDQKPVQKQDAVKKSAPSNVSQQKKGTSATRPTPVVKAGKSSKPSTTATAKPANSKPSTKAAASKPAVKSSTTVSAAPTSDSQLRKKISAKSAIIMDADSGQTLFALSPDTPRQPASTIKVLTGLIAIRSLDGHETVPVSHKAAIQPSSKVHLEHKKSYRADDLINAVLLSSANDASVALAEKIAGSEQSFAQMMTQRARLCGAQNTVCKTANGLTAEGQSSTARDLAVIFRHAMKDKEFSQRMKQVKAHTAEGKLLKNHNRALWQIQGAEGGKTGFTNAAGQTYVGKFKRGSREIIVALMGSHTMWTDLGNLVEYGFSQPAPMVADAARQEKKVVAGIAASNRQQ